MLQYSWQSAASVNPEQVSDFKNVIQVAFDFSALECGSEDCSARRAGFSLFWSPLDCKIIALRCTRYLDSSTGRWSVGKCDYHSTISSSYIGFSLLSSSLLSKNLKVRNYKRVILPVVLYCCESWTLTLGEEQRLRVFENKVLREIFGAKGDEVTGEWRQFHNAELHALYSSPDIIRNIKSRRLRWAGHVAHMGESRTAYRVLVGRPKGKRPLGRPRRRWEDNIEMDLRKVGYDDREWINLAQDRDQWRAYVRAAMNLRVP
ncbi:hypothetical protein ANN_09036 [Periplaneta americana]|uniref:Uncharacterized protein n=1 Tax=Periplaneta americana TaxID=6978 RepID=A0ABQ8TMU0_PERAM|nr:hypothetical protein ANN_09036 [Periplaneta americana]